jgi:hypothetical protein
MKTFKISPHIYQMFQEAAFNGLDHSHSTITSDGMVEFPVSDRTAERIEAVRKPGQTNDQLLFELLGGKYN